MLIAVGIGSFGATAFAALQWDTTVLEQIAALDQDRVEFKFAFTNSDAQPVTIAKVETSCGCTTASLEKKTYAPGEKGTLTALLDAKDQSGQVERNILVTTGEGVISRLTIRATIPSWLEVMPRLIWWQVGGKSTEKEAALTVPSGTGIRITSVQVDNPLINASLKPGADEQHYRLVVKPLATGTPYQARISIVTELAGSTPRTHIIFAQVR